MYVLLLVLILFLLKVKLVQNYFFLNTIFLAFLKEFHNKLRQKCIYYNFYPRNEAVCWSSYCEGQNELYKESALNSSQHTVGTSCDKNLKLQ